MRRTGFSIVDKALPFSPILAMAGSACASLLGELLRQDGSSHCGQN
jgi:hypothetical protein